MAMNDAEKLRMKALARWEGEGGALGRSGPRADALDDSELRILARIGYAALGQWDALPADVSAEVVRDVCRPLREGDGSRARTRIADFMRLYGDR